MSLLDLLAKKKLIAVEDIPSIKEEAVSSGVSLDDVLHKHGITDVDLLAAKSEYLQIPTRSLAGQEVPYEILKYIPEESALHYKIIPLAVVNNVLEVGLVDPDNIEARDALNFISAKLNMPFKIFIISNTDFERIEQTYKGLSGEVTKALTELESELSDEEKEIAREEKQEAAQAVTGQSAQKAVDSNIIEDAPVTKIVATVLRYAIEGNASDVHIEHMREKIRVRFRVDGVLSTLR